MAEDVLLEQIGKLIEPLRTQLFEQGANIVRLMQGQKRLETDVKAVDQKVETVDLKVEASHEFHKKAHAETMDTLLDIGEINYKELQKALKALKKRVEQLEGRQQEGVK